MPTSSWQELLANSGPASGLLPGQVQVWQMCVSSAHARLPELKRLLATDERERAARFRFDRDRDCYVATRGLLRLLVARYTGDRAEQIQLRYGAQGKPALADSGIQGLHFNVSHSGDAVLFAFSSDLEVGVDVELMREDADFAGLARTSFSPAELNAVIALAPEHRSSLFYEYWTCKEACIKADGRGLSVPLEQFSITRSRKGARWREVETAKSDVFHSALRVRILETIPGYAAAVAAPGDSWEVDKVDVRVPDHA